MQMRKKKSISSKQQMELVEEKYQNLVTKIKESSSNIEISQKEQNQAVSMIVDSMNDINKSMEENTERLNGQGHQMRRLAVGLNAMLETIATLK